MITPEEQKSNERKASILVLTGVLMFLTLAGISNYNAEKTAEKQESGCSKFDDPESIELEHCKEVMKQTTEFNKCKKQKQN